jgi:hypothetical protein
MNSAQDINGVLNLPIVHWKNEIIKPTVYNNDLFSFSIPHSNVKVTHIRFYTYDNSHFTVGRGVEWVYGDRVILDTSAPSALSIKLTVPQLKTIHNIHSVSGMRGRFSYTRRNSSLSMDLTPYSMCTQIKLKLAPHALSAVKKIELVVATGVLDNPRPPPIKIKRMRPVTISTFYFHSF